MVSSDRIKEARKVITRRTDSGGTVFPSLDEVVERIGTENNLLFYFGLDPTSPRLHIGHTVALLLMADLVHLGHKAVLLLGDFTARIGDPTDKEAARVALTEEQVRSNLETYIDQVKRIIPNTNFEVRYNSEWLSVLTLEQIIRLTSMATVQQMMARDMFQEREKRGKPIYVSEFLYPLMQGYDSVALRVDGEIGGNDQTFNMLVGRDLEKELLDKDKMVIATRLLVDAATGKKISKTEGGLIAFDDTPQDIRRKVLATVPDEMIRTVFELCTTKDQEWIDERCPADQPLTNPNEAKEELAAELIRMYHGQDAVSLGTQAIDITTTGPLDKVLKETGLATSMSEAKRLIDQRGVIVNGVVADRWDLPIKQGDEIRVGKGKFARVS
jgi:tyrosyl-tRNA synthetase